MSTDRYSRRRLYLLGFGVVGGIVLGAAVLIRVGESPQAHHQPPSATGTPTTIATERPDGGASTGRDEAGAVAAAVDYASGPQEWLYLTDEEAAAAVKAISTPEAADRLSDEAVERIRAARSELSKSPGRVWWIVHPLAWRVVSFTDTSATVSVWTVSVLSAADVAVPQTQWTTTTMELEWLGGWRVGAVHDVVGPTPAVGPEDQPWEPEPFDDALDGFIRVTSAGVG